MISDIITALVGNYVGVIARLDKSSGHPNFWRRVRALAKSVYEIWAPILKVFGNRRLPFFGLIFVDPGLFILLVYFFILITELLILLRRLRD